MSNEIRYLHFRFFDQFGNWEGKGGFTYAYRQEEGGVRHALAECSQKDNYSKQIGRHIAASRLDDPKKSLLSEGFTTREWPTLITEHIEVVALITATPVMRKYSRGSRKHDEPEDALLF
jgi:hypothetical protein